MHVVPVGQSAVATHTIGEQSEGAVAIAVPPWQHAAQTCDGFVEYGAWLNQHAIAPLAQGVAVFGV